MTYP
jgi:plastocyanin